MFNVEKGFKAKEISLRYMREEVKYLEGVLNVTKSGRELWPFRGGYDLDQGALETYRAADRYLALGALLPRG